MTQYIVDLAIIALQLVVILLFKTWIHEIFELKRELKYGKKKD